MAAAPVGAGIYGGRTSGGASVWSLAGGFGRDRTYGGGYENGTGRAAVLPGGHASTEYYLSACDGSVSVFDLPEVERTLSEGKNSRGMALGPLLCGSGGECFAAAGFGHFDGKLCQSLYPAPAAEAFLKKYHKNLQDIVPAKSGKSPFGIKECLTKFS